ncbi:amidohydrolase family protein [Pseudoalteromonas haloplanktis]|uniref:Amidohydrolase family protein n=1 Tax=Pseudoalteromonas haloplanktis TaxID=228 RepID=A0ABU1BG67_PSEHA|nr:amidohydrolase family protein [Pseudoalteromonas haloplanktis]MDQ9093469.1 amidohydrolase family protein [Pseudoalteromonas haloplanktis]
MLNHHKLVCFIFAVLFSGCHTTATAVNLENRSFSLVNVNVIDVQAKRIRYNQHVCVVDGIIVQLSENKCLNNNAKQIDGNGGYLTPGLIDMHVHMFEKEGLVFSLSHGVTHVRVMNGVSAQLKWRDDAEQGKILSSTASVSSPIISGYEDAVLHHGLSSPEKARQAVANYHGHGYDLIKVYNNLNSETFSALMRESRLLGIPVAKHAPDVPKPLDIVNYKDMQSFEHVEDIFYAALNRKMDIEALAPFIEKIKTIGVPITPTLNVFDQLTKLSSEKETFLNLQPEHYISTIVKLDDKRNQVNRWLKSSEQKAKYNKQVLSFLLSITKALHDSDIPLLIGTDSGNLLSPHGLATHNEMRLFYEAGISTFDILKAATYNAAKALKLDKQIGQIKEGFYADFIFTQGDPTKDLQQLEKPEAVAKRGIWLNRKNLENLRVEAEKSKSLWSELRIYSEMLTR